MKAFKYLIAALALALFSPFGAVAEEATTSIDLDTFIKAVEAANYNFDGSNHDSAQGGKLTVKWSPVSGCFDTRDTHTCTVDGVAATGNTPMRVNSHLAQFQLFEEITSAVSVKNVAFVYEPTDFTICANSGWKGSFTVDDAPAAQLYLMSTGDVTFEDCSFDKVVLTSFNCIGTSTATNCSFKNVYNSYAVKDFRGKTVSVTGCTFENCGAAIMLSGVGATDTANKVNAVTISGNTFTKVDVTDTAPADKVGTRGIIQIASSGDYSGTTFDFSDNETTDCGPVLRQLNKTVTLDATAKTNLNNLITDGASLYTEDTIGVCAVVDGVMGYDTLEAALAAVDEGKPLTFVTEAAWPVATPVYYNRNFYAKDGSKGALELAIDAANEANSDDVAKIYVRPGFTADELVLQEHQNLKTSLAIYGNDAQLSRAWGPCIEYTTENAAFHQLTKDVSISIYNLHKGAGVWGARVTDYTVDITLADCQDAYEIMINGSLAETSVNNYTIKRCTFDGTSMANTGGTVVSTSAGKIVIEDCTFANLTQSYVINPNNKNGGAMEVVVKNTAFTNCGKSGVAVIRVAGEKEGTSATVTLDSLTFDEYSAANAIGIGKKELNENNAGITYTITNTSGTLSVFEKGGTDETITATTTTLVASETYKGANFAADFYQDGDGVWHIATPKGLVAFSEKAADGTTFDGLTVVLDDDIDMTDVAYTSAKQFNGTFDGQGKTISNLTISECDATHTWSGLIAYSVGGTVKDLTITGAKVDCVRGAVLLGHGYGLTIDGVTIFESVVTGEQKCAGLLGMASEGSTHKITNCEVKNVQVNAATTKFSDVQGASFAGLVAFINRDVNVTITGNKVSGITFSGLLGEAYYNEHATLYYQYLSHPFIAALIGTTLNGTYDSTTATLSGNTVEATEGLLTGPTTNEYLGFYYRSDFATRAVTKIVIDGKVLVNRLVAQVGEEVYGSLADAFEAAEEGQTVTLLADVTENATIANDLTLDLNGYTINGGTVKASPTLTVTAKVTIKDSSEAQTGTIKREDTAANSGVTSHYVIDIQGSDASLTFESGTVVNNSGTTEGERAGASLVRVGNDDNTDAMPTLTIKGGTFTQNNFTAIKVDYGTFYFQGGTITCGNDEAVKNWASAYIQGGTVKGAVASWVYSKSICSSTLEISGGTINGNVYAMTYDGTGDKKATVNITGGTITGDLGIYQGKNIKSMTKFDDASKATIAVTGGKFKNEIKDTGYLATDLTTLLSSSETLYVVAPTGSELVSVKPEAEGSETVEVALPQDVLDQVSDTDKATALSETADNGNPVWVNIVAGIESSKSVTVDAEQNADASTIDITPQNITTPSISTGVQIAYEVDEVTGTESAEVAKKGDVVSAPVINVDNVETSAYFQVKVLIRQNGSTLATVPATNYVGVLKKSTKMTKAIVPVPWHSLADGENITVENIVKTANLTEGDKLYVYDTENKKYNVYVLNESKTWEPAAVYTIGTDGQMSSTSSGTPDSTRVARGSGVWLERQNTDTPIVTYGLASSEKQDTELAAGGSKESPTWNLVAVPSTEAMKLSDIASPANAANDTIIVPTEGAPKVYTVKDGKWGFDESTPVDDDGLVIKRNETDTTLPAGTGFWYLNGSDTEKKVNW